MPTWASEGTPARRSSLARSFGIGPSAPAIALADASEEVRAAPSASGVPSRASRSARTGGSCCAAACRRRAGRERESLRPRDARTVVTGAHRHLHHPADRAEHARAHRDRHVDDAVAGARRPARAHRDDGGRVGGLAVAAREARHRDALGRGVRELGVHRAVVAELHARANRSTTSRSSDSAPGGDDHPPRTRPPRPRARAATAERGASCAALGGSPHGPIVPARTGCTGARGAAPP